MSIKNHSKGIISDCIHRLHPFLVNTITKSSFLQSILRWLLNHKKILISPQTKTNWQQQKINLQKADSAPLTLP